MSNFFQTPKREYVIIGGILFFLALAFVTPDATPFLWFMSLVGSFPVIIDSFVSIRQLRITIDTFNLFALGVAFATTQVSSAAFIVLMLAFARLLDWRVATRTRDAVAELLKLKPVTALREVLGVMEEVPADHIGTGEVIVVRTGARLPVDGVVIQGTAYVNEAPVTGESVPIKKIVGDTVMSATLNESGVIKVRATNVGKNSTIERMAVLIRQAALHKSKPEKLADRFAGFFLPFVIVLGIGTYALTRDIQMTAALFLVACADDMAVAIPLAVTAALGHAARRGVVIKGGQWLDAIGNVRAVVLDKTGTLTYGTFAVQGIWKDPAYSEKTFWEAVGIAEKYSEHHVGRALVRHALTVVPDIPDADETEVLKGKGIRARYGSKTIVIGNEAVLPMVQSDIIASLRRRLHKEIERYHATASVVLINGRAAGIISVADVPRPNAREHIRELRRIGIQRIAMFTGDNEAIAHDVAQQLDIGEYHASMKPEEKLTEVTKISKNMSVAMIGDGINDAPALSRADVGIAMGGGTSVSVESADIVILNDNLSRVSEMILLGRRTRSVIRVDIGIWLVSNLIGFFLVFTGFAGPAIAALYNFVTDFFPLINSSRLFMHKKADTVRT